MNYRIFSSDGELREALHEAVVRRVSTCLSPYIGLLGTCSIWLLERLSSSRPGTHLVGHPDPVLEMIRSRTDLTPARPENLIEPLDLVVAIGPALEAVPEWFYEARAVFIATADRTELESWIGSPHEQAHRAWFFVLERDWHAVKGRGDE